MSIDGKEPVPSGEPSELATQAAESAGGADANLGPSPFVGFGPNDIQAGLQMVAEQALRQPWLVLEQQAAFTRDLLLIWSGQSELAPESGDKRFQDSVWQSNPFYRATLQTYLAWGKSLQAFVNNSALDHQNRERARFVVSQLIDALSPTNTLAGNPAALKKLLETGGRSLVRGVSNWLGDVAHNGGMPAMVDKAPFQVGKNIGVSPGAVVFRSEVLELIQYAPQGEQVYGRPLVIVPPQVNKFYVMDLGPGRSLIEHQIKRGVQLFMISWRNPTKEHRDWGLQTYMQAIAEAIDAAREITGSAGVNVVGACAGGMTLTALLAHLAATGDLRIHAVSLFVTLLDLIGGESQLGLFATPPAIAAAKQASQQVGVLEGREMGRVFAWLRPNDLVWNYWVNNYLLGNDPPAFDILFWNGDTTRLPARFHHQLLDLSLTNPFRNPGTLELLGTPIDLSRIKHDTYLIAGTTDHITPWKGCYQTTQLFGGECTFVLSSSGHIQAMVNPPGNPKAKFFTNARNPAEPEDWLAGAQPQSGSWWDHWHAWLAERSGEQKQAPTALGSRRHPPGVQAPGMYVVEP